MPSFTLPGHKYLGPGNKLFSGKPTNEADKVARRHDFKYHLARGKKDIFRADHEAIKEFGTTKGISATIGKYGLSAKNFAEEKLLNQTIYPRFSGKYESTKKSYEI